MSTPQVPKKFGVAGEIVREQMPDRETLALFVSVLLQSKLPVCQRLIEASMTPFLPALHAFIFQDQLETLEEDIFEVRRRIAKVGFKRVLEVREGRVAPVFKRKDNKANLRRSTMRDLYRKFVAQTKSAPPTGEDLATFTRQFHRLKSQQNSVKMWRKFLYPDPQCAQVLGRILAQALVETLDLRALFQEFNRVANKFLYAVADGKTPAQVRTMSRRDILTFLNANQKKYKGNGYTFDGLLRRLDGFQDITHELGMAELSRAILDGIDGLKRAQEKIEQSLSIEGVDMGQLEAVVGQLRQRVVQLTGLEDHLNTVEGPNMEKSDGLPI